MILQSWHCLRLPFFGSSITGDLFHSISHLFCSQIFWHRAVSAFTVRSTILLISSEGMSSIPGYVPVFTAASTSPSVPADCPHFHWLVCSMEPSVSSSLLYMSPQFHAHLISNPSLSVVSLLSLSSMAASSASWFLWYHCVCRSLVGLFAVPAFIPFSMASHRSSIQLCLVDLIFFLTSLCNVGTDPCFIIWVSHPFSSRFMSHTSKVSFIIQIWIFSVSS